MIPINSIVISLERSFNFFISSFPYIILGFLISAYIKIKLKGKLRQKFMHVLDSSKKSIIIASIIGAVLPLCSASGVPIANVMNKKGANFGITMSFIVSASSITPLGLMLIFSILGSKLAVLQIIMSIILSCIVGIIFYNEKMPLYTFEEFDIKKEENYLSILYNQSKNLMPPIIFGFLLSGFLMEFIPKDIILYALSNSLMMYFYVSFARIFIFLCPHALIPLINSVSVNGVSNGLIISFLISAPTLGLPMIFALNKSYGKYITIKYILSVIISSAFLGIIYDSLF
ncbi:permease [Methanococcus vannielii SB]|uniref:Permease n=1 Tax=Methanococcus vannielii (strain ATCC 35089 / DSM 1224 / JCM 13029 / OCM 148 / SB) TaxID=406327 RepID=A6UNY6_METVS|nr:permease [Methanococcus vannielii]ABR54208.1 permease [Methanococcus vannielii SB]